MEGNVSNSTERHWMVGAAIVLGVGSAVIAIWRSRVRVQMGLVKVSPGYMWRWWSE